MSEKNFSALAEYFKSKGVTQSAIAEKLGVSKAYVNSLMTGKKAFGKAQAAKWSEMFGISASWLLTGEGDMIPPVETDAKDAIKSRITQYIEATNSATSVRDFLLKAGLSASFISGLSRGIGRDAKEKIQRTYTSLNVGWLDTGEGEMLKDGAPATQPVQENSARPLVSSDRDWVDIPLVPHRAQAGALSGFGDPCWEEDKQTMPVLIDKRLKGDYLLFEVSGDSMDDGSSTAFLDGDILLCRVLPKSDWQFGIKKRGETYCVVATDAEGIVLKEVVNHDKANNEITCHSLNSQYKDYSVKLDDVQGIFYVEELVKRKF